MSLFDCRPKRVFAGLYRAGLLAALAAAAITSACTVRPLYSEAALATAAAPANTAGLRSISISPVDTRYGQQLRNDLIFLLNGGAGQPTDPKYRMALTATVLVINEAVVQVDNEDRPTAATLQMTGSYVLTDLTTGNEAARGSRVIPASYDQPSQEFANLRARLDAENRAARELAELLRLDVAQKLAKL
jgi:LPS-assembly lipoprotein